MNSLGMPEDAQPTDQFATIPDVPIQSDSNIVNPNQVRSGMQRGAPVVNYGADGNPQVLQGNQQTFGNGFFVAKAGKNVITTNSLSDLIFNSNQNTFKIVLSGSATLNANATAGIPITTTVVHNLGYIPIPMAFTNFGATQYQQLPNSSGFGTSVGQMAFNNWSYATTDATNLYLTFISGSTLNWGTFTYKYYLLQETAA